MELSQRNNQSNSSLRSNHQRNISSTITVGDFMRIRNNIIPSTADKEEKQGREAHLRSISQSRITSWPDSIQNAKRNKLLEKKKAYYEQEMEKRNVEDEEKKFNELQRAVIIEKANKKLFDAQDQVKLFKGKMLVSDVLKEREYQNDIKKMKQDIEKGIDNKWMQMEQKKMNDYDQNEIDKKEKEKEKIRSQMEFINKQYKEAKIKRVINYQDAVVEGQVIKKKAIEDLEKDKKKEFDKREKAKKIQAEFIEANIELKKHKELIKEKNREEERKIEEFAIAKEQMIDLKKKKEKERNIEKQAVRQKMIEQQCEYLRNLKSREEEILEKQKREVEEKKRLIAEEKEKRLSELKHQIDEHAAISMKRKSDALKKDKQEDKQFVECWKERMAELENNEQIQKSEVRNRNKNLQNFHRFQMEQKRIKAEEEFMTGQEESYKTKMMLQTEQDDYFKYAEGVVKDYYNNGKDITPLILDLKSYKKKMLYD